MMENLLKKWKKVICQNDLWWVTIKSPKQKRKPREERILKHLILGWHARITSYYSRISGGWCLVTSFLWDGFFFFRTLSWLHLTGVSTTPCWQTSPTKRLSQRWLQKSLSPRITHHYGRKVSSLPRLVGTPNHRPSIKNPKGCLENLVVILSPEKCEKCLVMHLGEWKKHVEKMG